MSDNEKEPWAQAPDGPHAFLQHKNTDICMDVYCLCGKQFHIDGYFAGQIQCPHCKQLYLLPWHVKIYPIERENEEMSGPRTVGDTDEKDALRYRAKKAAK